MHRNLGSINLTLTAMSIATPCRPNFKLHNLSVPH